MDFISICIVILSTISFVFSVLLILVHFIIPKTRRHPGQLILIQSFFQVLIDLSYIIASFNFSLIESDRVCYAFGLIFTLLAIQSDYFFAVFAVEIYFEIKKKFCTTHLNRCRIYYILSFFIFVGFLTAGILSNGYGKENQFSCFAKTSSVFGDVVIFFLLFIDLVLLVFLFLSLKINTTRSKTIKKHLALVFLCEAFIITSYVTNLAYSHFDYTSSSRVGLVFLAPLGSIIAMFRLWNEQLFREIQWKLCPKSIKIYYLNNEEKFLRSTLLNIEGEGSTISDFILITSIKVFFI
jgi:hypothetical protein